MSIRPAIPLDLLIAPAPISKALIIGAKVIINPAFVNQRIYGGKVTAILDNKVVVDIVGEGTWTFPSVIVTVI